MKHKYTIEIYKVHFNPELYELANDYEANVHCRPKPDRKYVREFMAYSPIYNHDDKNEYLPPSAWEGNEYPMHEDKSLEEIR